MYKFRLSAFADEADSEIDGQIKALHGNGINLIELRGVGKKGVTELTESEMRDLRRRLDDEGIAVWSIGSPIGKIELGDDFEKHLEVFRHALELANIAGAERMRIFSFYVPAGEADKHRSEVMDKLGRLVSAADGSGVTLCHENEKGIYGDMPERCVDIHKSIPSLRAVYDPANFVQCGADTLKAWDMLEPYINYMHMKDADETRTVVPAGKGVANVPELLKRYEKIGGDVITLEPHLFEFANLASLEREGEKSAIGKGFSDKRIAFDCGVNALKELMK